MGRPWGTGAALFRSLPDMKIASLPAPLRILAAGLVLGLSAPAPAATPAAWQGAEAEARRACLRASDLAGAEIASGPILFSDNAGKTAFLVRGRWRPAHMRGARTTMLCLYDRASRRAETAEARGWNAR